MTSMKSSIPTGGKFRREQVESVIRTALLMEEIRFARHAALAWLGQYPGDLPINLLYAKSLIRANLPEKALPILERICQSDPEFQEAVEALVQVETMLQHGSQPKDIHSKKPETVTPRLGWLLALGGSPDVIRDAGRGHSALRDKTLLTWSKHLAKARLALQLGDLDQAESQVHAALVEETNCPLVNATHLKILNARMKSDHASSQMLRSLAAYYHERWPETQVCTLLLAEALLDSGESDQAVVLLHEAAAKDITGQVVTRLWGKDHPYQTLWPSELEVELDLPLPASVTSALGWNRLPDRAIAPKGSPRAQPQANEESTLQPGAGRAAIPATPAISPVKPSAEQSNPNAETLRSIQAELERLGQKINRPGLAHNDGRFPVYVVMTTRQGLLKRLGEQTAAVVESELLRLVNAIQGRRDWGALLFYADDVTFLRRDKNNPAKLDRPAVRANDPWGLKLALLDLDNALKKYGERIGAVLIVGGAEIVPFHQLPNPVDDADSDVPSDNPYGTRDENYFIPEWPIGRIPDGVGQAGGKPQTLLYALSGLTARHLDLARNEARSGWYQQWWERMLTWVKRHAQLSGYVRPSFGYTAAIWRQASMSVFRPIGEPRALQVSPPETDPHSYPAGNQNGRNSTPLPAARLGYFNLHGVEDAAEWYGQRDPGSDSTLGPVGEGEDYPIAVRPSDILNSGRAPQVVFSEACYGAHIINKSTDQALSLRFLQVGTQAVVGSTCISYGSISPPLIAADFLGHAFWSFLREGVPAGEALRRAKISLAREMHNRQGYLDGEDQKTLISFVLYGDPLAIPVGLERTAKSILRPARPPAHIKTVCDLAHQETADKVPPEILEFVKNVVEQYLPGMADASLTLSHEHIGCEAASSKHQPGLPDVHSVPSVDHLETHQPFQLARQVVTLSKQVPNSAHTHRHYARLTLDARGKLVKLVVSR